MLSKPADLRKGLPMPGDKGLAVKDGLREVRFNLRLGARLLIQAAQTAAHRDDESGVRGLGSIGEPLNLAIRTTATLLSHVDHVVVDLLAPDGPYRAMAVPLRSSSSYFGVPVERHIDLRTFTTDHHWRYRHWLSLTGRRDVFVHEQAIERAGAKIAADVIQPGPGRVIQSLAAQPVLSMPTVSPDAHTSGDLTGLRSLGAVVTTLAGEIAPLIQELDTRSHFATSLRLADEIAYADRYRWERALNSVDPLQALDRWLASVLRHV